MDRRQVLPDEPSEFHKSILRLPRWIITGCTMVVLIIAVSLLGMIMLFCLPSVTDSLILSGATLAGCSTTHHIYLISASATLETGWPPTWTIRAGYYGVCASTSLLPWHCESSGSAFLNNPSNAPWTDLNPDPKAIFQLMDAIRSQDFRTAGNCLVAAIAIVVFLIIVLLVWSILVGRWMKTPPGPAQNNAANTPLDPMYSNYMNERLSILLLLLSLFAMVLAFVAAGLQYGAAAAVTLSVSDVTNTTNNEAGVLIGEMGQKATLQAWVGAGFVGLGALGFAWLCRVERWRRRGERWHQARPPPAPVLRPAGGDGHGGGQVGRGQVGRGQVRRPGGRANAQGDESFLDRLFNWLRGQE
ncbi:hypothetical protein NA57DRAFT_59364 [Rhizodiscina lignyota]|uniref:Uncharacterized protein n=1 Tax=Rhizodiscina lignyota TaxID=1504668 RepID=A0A9P4I5G6_9PEZI|nr:hypothetical protein NA57DRAFT_59364 [Rhizodiscina lignyota]